MNFLQICQRVRQECGISGNGPLAVARQVGMYAKIVDWVKAAHEEIQTKRTMWRFDWFELTQALTIGAEAYAPASDWGLKVRSWARDSAHLYRTAAGPTSRHWLAYLEWDQYRDLRTPAVPGMPIYWTQAPDRRLMFYPIPDQDFTLVAEGYRSPEILVQTTDIPRLPEEYHMAIVWRAVMLYCGHDENQPLFQTAQANYKGLISRIEATELPGMMTGEPLA